MADTPLPDLPLLPMVGLAVALLAVSTLVFSVDPIVADALRTGALAMTGAAWLRVRTEAQPAPARIG